MNRRQKIIVSVTGIFIVLLALVGLTYAYFLTQITDNQNPTSISVTTKNMVLEYGEGTSVIQGINNAEPGYSVEKTFSATNKGDDTSYVVVLENVQNGLTRKQDLVYSLTCESVNTETGAVSGTCDGKLYEKFPATTDLSVIIGNEIDEGITHNYKLTVTYKEMGIDQSIDMNKTFSAKVNIMDIKSINPYDTGDASTNKTSLAYNIINNAMLNKNGTQFVNTPPSKVGEEYVPFNQEIATVTVKSTSPNLIYGDSLMDLYSGGSSYPINKCNNTLVGKAVLNKDGIFYYNSNEYYYDNRDIEGIVGCDGDDFIVETNVNSGERVLSAISDDYGTSYYFRGIVQDNYVNFAGMCWKIVRIQGDGSIKLLLDDQNAECNDFETTNSSAKYAGNQSIGQSQFGKKKVLLNNDSEYEELYGYVIDYNKEYPQSSTPSMSTVFKKFQTENLSGVTSKLKTGDWCINDNAYSINTNDLSSAIPLTETEKINLLLKALENYPELNTIYYYDSFIRNSLNNKSITLKCNGTNMTKFNDDTDMKVGTLTVDEVILSGSSTFASMGYGGIMNSYLSLDMWGTFLPFITLSPSFSDTLDFVWSVNNDGAVVSTDNLSGINTRPAIILNEDTTIVSGDGTHLNPYVIG